MASARSERSDENSELSAECSAWFTLLSTLGAAILAPAGNPAPSLNSTLTLLLQFA